MRVMNVAFVERLSSERSTEFYRVAVAALVGLAASLLVGGLEPSLGATTHMFVALVVVLTAALCGTLCGLVALGTTAAIVSATFLAPPLVPFAIRQGYVVLLAELLALGGVVVVVGRLRHQLSEARAHLQRREMLLQNLVDAMPAPVAAFDDDNRYLVANQALAKTLGLEPSEMIGRSHDEVGGFRAYLPPDVTKTLRSERQDDGKVYSILDFPIRDGAGRPQARGVMAFDITEQREQELRLYDSEARHRALLEAIPDAIVRHDAQGHYLEIIPPKTFQLIDVPPDLRRADGTKVGVDDLLPEDVARGFREHFQRVLTTGGIQSYEYVVSIDGTPSYREARTVAVNESELVSIIRDFTEQKKQQRHLAYSEARLRESEARNRALLEAIPDAIVHHDREGRYFDLIPSKDFDFAWSPEHVSGQSRDTLFEGFEGNDADILKDCARRAFETKRTQICGYSVVLNGKIRHREVRMVAMNDDEGLSIIRDVTEQREQELRLRESEARNRALIEAIPDAIIRHDRTGCYLDVHVPDDLEPIRPVHELIGKRLGEVLPPAIARDIEERLERVLVTGERETYRYGLPCGGNVCHREARMVKLNGSEVISIVRDITEQTEQERALRESEARNRALLAAIPDAIVRHRRDDYYAEIIAPDDFETIYPVYDMFGREPEELVASAYAQEARERLEHVLSTGQRQSYRYTITIAGRVHHREARIVPLNDDEAISVVRDITEQTEQEQALRESEARNRALIEAIPDTIVVFDSELRIAEVRLPKTYTLLRPPDTVIGKRPEEVTDPETAQRFRELSQRVRTQGGVGRLEEKIVVNGVTAYRDHRFTRIDDQRILALVRDITEQKRYEQSLRESEARNRALLAAIPDGIVLFDNDCRILEVRPPKDFVPLKAPDQLVGRYQHELSDETTARAVAEAVRSVLRRGGVERVEEGKLSADGVTVYRDYRITAVDDRTALALVRDITEQKRYEQSLIEADHNKSRFLAMMSHELRTPLTSVIGFAEILLERFPGPLNDQQAEYIGYVHESGKHLLSLLNDVLDLSKIEAGGLELSLELVYPTDLARSVLDILKEKAHKHGLTLRTDFPERCAPLRADARKLKQMLFNYLSNAAKFTPSAGTVTLRIEETPSEIRFEVRDSGIGIAPENHDKLFKAFSQIENSEQHRHPGTGLGLSLVEKFAELHGGRVWVESVLGEGSTFGFSVSRRLGEDAATA